MSKTLHLENIEKAQRAIEMARPLINNAKMRQRYHFMAEEGWMNDPNGLIFFNNQYHFFYQYNPYDTCWGAMHWGHAVSYDMIHWEYLPIALAPSEHYDNHEKGGCFSGSSIEHDGKLYLLYTGTTNYGDGFVQTQCLAYSEDGIHFDKYDKNPIITAPNGYDQANFRDPKIWKHGDYFYLVCGAQKDNLAKALLYRSLNLKDWEFINVLAESRGEFGYMWECPDFFQIGDKHVLMFSPMGLYERKTVYLVGDMDYKTGKFNYSTIGEIDWGFDYYAPQSFLDNKGRRIIVGWANAWDWMPWWKDWGPTFKENWCGSFGIPREVKLLEDNTLMFIPVEEFQQLRYDENKVENIEVKYKKYEIHAGDGVAYELKIEIDLGKTTAESFQLLLRCSDVKETVITFDLKKSELTFNRNNSDDWSTGISRSTLKLNNKNILDIHIFSDQSSIEVFTDNYQNNHSGNIFAGNNQNKNYIVAKNGTVAIRKLYSWGMKTVMK
ncbi:glycoside hydrolase family 32 protein [Thermoanaerobacterium sp. RBIITD]|uniref:glycoside hydrolase family 32 protein n=1 Tax=Thermoanaerobacterium sp. RBIITD TaxID=1550240 RepID=UPI000BB88A3B|nr:glycoside hydrolase family 32 protein [Thermoanaerobacterium sp. RBIITD]SNX54412.1 beta-fructofuranosidase [Thermoanaerobacterium sp. RBIITD]